MEKVLVLVFFYILGVVDAQQRCYLPNEVFDKCLGHCDKTCDNPNPTCTKMCKPGCICKKGFLRNTLTGQCVPPSLCPNNRKCKKENEVFSPCNGHCDKTCDNPNPICAAVCQAGCICREGYLRDTTTGQCIPADKCPQKCKLPTEIFSPCRGHCDRTCDNPDPACNKMCVPGCICKDGLLRDTTTGQCVPEHKCPKKCGENEVFSPCNGHCDKTCDNPNPVCTAVCQAGCICKEGYLRDTTTGRCIPANECPQKCNLANEIFSPCRGHCDKTCDNPNPICNKMCKPGCICTDGYLRDKLSGDCVLPENCSNRRCKGPNEYYTTCGTACPDTCANYKDKNRVCTLQCVEGCFCLPGFVRDTYRNECVRPEECILY